MLPLRFLPLAFATLSFAAPSVSKVEPPNWWVRHTRNPIQLLLTGADLKGATISTTALGFRVETRRTSDNGHYLFAYVTIDPSARPGHYRFQVKSASGTGDFEFALDTP